MNHGSFSLCYTTAGLNVRLPPSSKPPSASTPCSTALCQLTIRLLLFKSPPHPCPLSHIVHTAFSLSSHRQSLTQTRPRTPIHMHTHQPPPSHSQFYTLTHVYTYTHSSTHINGNTPVPISYIREAGVVSGFACNSLCPIVWFLPQEAEWACCLSGK